MEIYGTQPETQRKAEAPLALEVQLWRVCCFDLDPVRKPCKAILDFAREKGFHAIVLNSVDFANVEAARSAELRWLSALGLKIVPPPNLLPNHGMEISAANRTYYPRRDLSTHNSLI